MNPLLLGQVGLSLFGMRAQNKAQAKAAEANIIAMRQKAKARELAAEQARVQAKADSVYKLEKYNDMAATQMVMGVASGRIVGEGSTQAMMNDDYSRYRWDQLWATKNEAITQAAIYSDVAQLMQAGVAQGESARGQIMYNTANTLANLFQTVGTMGTFRTGGQQIT